jgi:glycosyltransferase involved in cell wall biosynthesis
MKKFNTTGLNPQLFKVSVIIPALDPPNSLIELIHDLKAGGIQKIVVVNDGSAKDHKKIFNKLSEMGATVLNHPINRGYGASIKTGIAYIAQNHATTTGIITADSDGQHTAKDIIKTAQEMKENPEVIILGIRRISLFRVPFRNFVGNFFASVIFGILTGKKISDTQCGLKGIPISLVPNLITLSGQRYEYAVQTLVYLVRTARNIIQVPIETIYTKSITSHFRPFADSWAIFKELLK